MKIGTYQIPTFRLYPKVEEAARLIYESYKLEEAKDQNSVAILCGHKSSNSGGWLYKLADMRAFGLVEKRGIKITTLAEKFLAGTEEEKQKATNEVILNIPLWRELYLKFGNKLPENNFWVQLQQITNIPNIEAQKNADSIRKAYLEDINHYKPEKEDMIKGDIMEPVEFESSVVKTELEPFTFGNIKIILPKVGQKEAWIKAKKMMDIYLENEK